jgi:hypothetical protein
MGETLELQLRLRGGQAAPEVAGLRADFDVLDVRQGVRTSIVNGRRDESIDWTLTLAPKRVGSLEIPAFRAGDAESAPVVVQVSDAADLGAHEPGAASSAVVRLETEIDDAEPYVQGKVLLTARLYADASVLDGVIADPVVDGALLERVGEDRSYRSQIGGRSFDVVERQYALFPQRSGELEIGPVVFDGRVRDERQRRRDPFGDVFGGFSAGFGAPGGLMESFFGAAGRPVRASSEPLHLAVRARPELADGQWWLPARNVELVEQWAGGTPVFRVGQPVTRDVAIRATGLSGAQLPALALPEIDGMKQYAETPVDDTVAAGDEVVSVKLQRVALVPTRAGSITLPPIEVAWWDTEADVARSAHLPGRSVQVLPGNADLAAAPPVLPPGDAYEEESIRSAAALERGVAGWVGAGLGVLILGAVGVPAFRRSRFFQALPTQQGRRGPQPGLRRSERRLRRACRASDSARAVLALRDIAACRWPDAPPQFTSAWAQRLGVPELEAALDDLNRALYSRTPGAWDGRSLRRAYRLAGRPGRQQGGVEERVLPALYPTR